MGTIRLTLRSSLYALSLLALASGCNKGGTTTTVDMGGCTQSTECPAGKGVCRAGMCTMVPCSPNMACLANEMCGPNNTCVPGTTQPMACMQSSECPPALGVCRGMKCTAVPCSMAMPCLAMENCMGGMCVAGGAAAVGVPGHGIASGGSIAHSDKHIHIGLTGQGKAVGPSAATHKHVGGATAVMQGDHH